MIFTNCDVDSLLNNKRDVLDGYIRNLSNRVDNLMSPLNVPHFNYVFMPCHSYPELHGFRISENDTYRPLAVSGKLDGLFLEYWPDWSGNWEYTLYLDEILIKFVGNRKSKNTAVVYGNKQVAKLPYFEHGTIGVRLFNDGYYLSINNRRLIKLENKTFIDKYNVSMDVNLGDIYLIQFQIKYNEGLEYKSFYNCEPARRKVIAKTSPKWVLWWEKQSKYLYHTSIMSMVVLDVLEHSPSLALKYEKIIPRIKDYSEYFLSILTSWPHWRPAEANDPENGLWERNNWSNGYIPGAFGILAKLTNKHKSNEILRKFIASGLSWLNYMYEYRGAYFHRFPDSRHWVNRSTNHGLVIYSSFLVGAEALELEHFTLDSIKDEFTTALGLSFEDGCYLEGLNYFQFVLLELIPYIWISYRNQTLSWFDFICYKFSYLHKIPEFLYFASSDGEVMARFGDCETNHWINTSLNFIDSLNKEFDFSNHYSFASDINSEGDEYLPLAILLKEENRENFSNESECVGNVKYKIFDSTQMAGVKVLDGDDVWSIWVNGSKLHKTHNKDHDIGSFFLYKNSLPWITEIPGHAAWKHNVSCIEGKLNENNSDSFSTYGDISQDGVFQTRQQSGFVSHVETENYLCINVKTPGIYLAENGKLINSLVRNFIIIKESGFLMYVIDHIKTDYSDDLYSNFIFKKCTGESIIKLNQGVLEFSDIGYVADSLSSEDSFNIKDIPEENIYSRVIQKSKLNLGDRVIMSRVFGSIEDNVKEFKVKFDPNEILLTINEKMFYLKTDDFGEVV